MQASQRSPGAVVGEQDMLTVALADPVATALQPLLALLDSAGPVVSPRPQGTFDQGMMCNK